MSIFEKFRTKDEQEKIESEVVVTTTIEDLIAGRDTTFNELMKNYKDAKAQSIAIREEMQRKAIEVQRAIEKRRQKGMIDNINMDTISNILNHESMEDYSSVMKLKRLSKMPISKDTNVLKAKHNLLTYMDQFTGAYDEKLYKLHKDLQDTMNRNRIEELKKESAILRFERVLSDLQMELDMISINTGNGPIQNIKSHGNLPTNRAEGAIRTALSITAIELNQ